MIEDLKISKKTAYVAILTIGIVSMLGDIVYESARGIAPDYLSSSVPQPSWLALSAAQESS